MLRASGEHREMPPSLTRASSELELVAHKKQVLGAAHGGVWDAHSSAERAALMKGAIHSMTEAGLDEEVAQKVRGGGRKSAIQKREWAGGRAVMSVGAVERRGAWWMRGVRRSVGGGGREREHRSLERKGDMRVCRCRRSRRRYSSSTARR